VSDENQVTRRFSICGNPGIGKSWFLFYAMYRLGQEGKSMVYAHTIGGVSFFTVIAPPNKMQRSVPNKKMREMVKDSSVWYLVDGPVRV
jgi:predicted ATP-dependent serine protease